MASPPLLPASATSALAASICISIFQVRVRVHGTVAELPQVAAMAAGAVFAVVATGEPLATARIEGRKRFSWRQRIRVRLRALHGADSRKESFSACQTVF
jgi:hypothetical protein